jgi:uncharacterized membrane protein YdjX (TVP38/TMEM64 family)
MLFTLLPLVASCKYGGRMNTLLFVYWEISSFQTLFWFFMPYINPTPSSRNRFIQFFIMIIFGLATSYFFIKQGVRLTPEFFQNFVQSLGIVGPVIYTFIFIIRPFFLIPSISLFIAGGLAFGPIWGPTYASVGAVVGGTLAFLVARKMGHEYVMAKLKLGTDIIENARFGFWMVFILSLIPVMPVTVINYGSGISSMSLRSYITAHVLGITPRIFAFGFLGNTLLEVGSSQFKIAVIGIVLMAIITLVIKKLYKQKMEQPLTVSYCQESESNNRNKSQPFMSEV